MPAFMFFTNQKNILAFAKHIGIIQWQHSGQVRRGKNKWESMLRFATVLLVLAVAGCGRGPSWHLDSTALGHEFGAAGSQAFSGRKLVVPGKTFPSPGHVSEIAATVMHPVEKVLVKPGDIVHAGQPLFELDADEAQADVRARRSEVEELAASLAKLKAMPRAEERAEARSLLESAQIEARAARAQLERLEALREHDAVSARQYNEQKTAALCAEAEERAAQAHLDYLMKLPIEHEIAEAEHQLAVAKAEFDAAEAELEHYTIPAAIDGVICWLEATPGSVHRAGTKVWGEIVDLREVDVRIELTPKQLNDVDFSQPIQVEQPELGRSWPAQFVYAAPAADRATGLVPVVLRVGEAGEPLRCHLNVTVSLALADGDRSSRTPHGEALAAEASP
ncbi:MAG TPA: efflux RND transporter periplasmic adaptor subunit [Pirellulales bacterium]|nr:efflux RND transporter periplasmic adaptor subunit [Pirellulales bacterium]